MSYHSFTPTYVYQQYRRRLIAGLLLVALVAISTNYLFFPGNSFATTTVEWEGSDFGEGTVVDATSTDTGITLKISTSTSDDTREEFVLGDNVSGIYSTAFPADGGVTINQGYVYTEETDPVLPNLIGSDYVQMRRFNENILYIGTNQTGLYVYNLNDMYDPTDDVLLGQYTSTTSPALPVNRVWDVDFDGDLVYVTTYSGISVIDTKGTTTLGDDTLVFLYNSTSTPQLADQSWDFNKRDNLIYIESYGAGMTIIDTKSTDSVLDDTSVRYHTSSTPALASNRVYDIDNEGDFIYVSTLSGLSVIDTKSTATSSDDTINTYTTATTPAIFDNYVSSAVVIDDIVYMTHRFGSGPYYLAIDTKGTATFTDDVMVEPYLGENGEIDTNYVTSISRLGNYLYVREADEGTYVVDTKGTKSMTDDEIIDSFLRSENVVFDSGSTSVLPLTNKIFYNAWYSLSLITRDVFSHSGVYISSPRAVASLATTTITLDAAITNNQDVALSYRTGSSTAVWRNDFNTIDKYAGDLYAWGEEFQNATITDGVLTLSNPTDSVGFIWIDTGYPADHFPAGSIITARVRFNSVDTDRVFRDWMYIDDWYDNDIGYHGQNEWLTLQLKANAPFSSVGFEPYMVGVVWDPADSWQLDYIQITTPDSMGNWSSWNACPNQTCILGDLGTSTYLQYKLDLETDDTSTTPTVHSVSYNGDYESTGTYTSAPETFRQSQDLLTFNADITTSASTSVAFEYTTDGGDTWSSITPGDNFPQNTTTETFQWRATLTTADGAYTPTINRVSMTATTHHAQTGTMISERVAALRDITSPEAVAVLKEHYPEYFENPDAPLAKEKAMVILLTEVLRLFNLLKTTKIEEGSDL